MTTPSGTVRPRRGASRSTTPVSVPAIMSMLTRSTWSENTRSRERSGMYSPNGAGCCLA
ncbi:Uncharacterised protein [Mycobacteroides abscessus]|nr:Uncharacterised protein [Mycobacteroides abscessus]